MNVSLHTHAPRGGSHSRVPRTLAWHIQCISCSSGSLPFLSQPRICLFILFSLSTHLCPLPPTVTHVHHCLEMHMRGRLRRS